MPYKDPQKQAEYRDRWKADHPEKQRAYSRESEKRDSTKKARKRYSQSASGKASQARRSKTYFETHGGYVEATKNYPSRSPEAQRNAYYKFAHGVTIEEFEAQIVRQNNLCPIGKHPFGKRGKQGDSPCQDHDHENGQNRLILCRNHNVMLGLAQDDPEILESAILYLQSFKKETGELQCLTHLPFVARLAVRSN
jgi:hypothetical protein